MISSAATLKCDVRRGRAAAGRSSVDLTLPAARDPGMILPFRAAVYGLADRSPHDAVPHIPMIIAAYRLARPMLRAGVTSEVEFVRATGRQLARVMEGKQI